MLDTCPPRQCLTWSIFEVDPHHGYEFNLSYVKTLHIFGLFDDLIIKKKFFFEILIYR